MSNEIPKFKYVDDNIVKNFFVKEDNKVYQSIIWLRDSTAY